MTTLGDWLLSFFLIFIWVAWIWLVISILIDIFRSDDLSGWGKAGWTLLVVFLTWIGVLIYLIARGKGMNERRFADAARAQQAQADYIRQVAAESGARAAPVLLTRSRNSRTCTSKASSATRSSKPRRPRRSPRRDAPPFDLLAKPSGSTCRLDFMYLADNVRTSPRRVHAPPRRRPHP